eukprot:Skav212268  [mRNA]  locus=scaffold732:108669:114311:- [translate_table: standard]
MPSKVVKLREALQVATLDPGRSFGDMDGNCKPTEEAAVNKPSEIQAASWEGWEGWEGLGNDQLWLKDELDLVVFKPEIAPEPAPKVNRMVLTGRRVLRRPIVPLTKQPSWGSQEQDFKGSKKTAKAKKGLFEDADFPAVNNSIGGVTGANLPSDSANPLASYLKERRADPKRKPPTDKRFQPRN